MERTAGLRDRLDALSEYLYAAAILTLSGVATALFVWLMYDNRGAADIAGREALMNALLVSDVAAFLAAAAAVGLCAYLGALHTGSLRGTLRLETLAIASVIMLAPIVFVGADILLQPEPLRDHGAAIAFGLSVVSVVSGAVIIALSVVGLRPEAGVPALIDRLRQEYHEAGARGSADSVTIMPLMTGTSLSLIVLLRKLCATGDPGAVRQAIDRLSGAALEESKPAQDAKSLAAAGGLVAHIVEAGAIGAGTGNRAVVCRAIERLEEIATATDNVTIADAAFQGIAATHYECQKAVDRFPPGTFGPWLADVYARVYDATGRPDALGRAVSVIEQTLADSGTLDAGDRARALYVSGQIIRRAAEAENSEEKALMAISRLTEARAAGAAGSLATAFADAGIGQAYVALAAMKNPIKSYKKALAQYEDAGKTLSPAAARHDAATLDSLQGYAWAMLADEYGKARRPDDALNSARAAIERYAAAARYFTPDRSPREHSLIMSGAGLAHTLISEIYTDARDFDGALKQARLAIDCYTSAIEATDKAKSPEGFASLKVSLGIAQVDLAEICFKEKRYDEAISACDRAIASYNEALRIYEGRGKEKQAAPARKYLKEANDLFNTFMMIGSGRGGRQLELGEGH